MIWKRLFVFTLLMVFLQGMVFGQRSDPEMIRIETLDGNIMIGTLLSESDDQLVMEVEGIGEITVQKSNIRRIDWIDPSRIRNGEYWFDNPQGTRYFFAPNAIGLRKGHGYYQNTWVFFNNVNYGVTNNFSIGGGLVPGFLLGGGLSATPVWILPKLSIPIAYDKVHLAAGAMIGGTLGSDGGGGGLLYGSGTFGSSDNNVTVGLGYGFAGGELSDTPLVNISGMYRVKRTVYLLTEIYFLPGIEESGFALFGGRWAPERFAVDFGILSPLSVNADIIGLPWLGVTIPFGR
ncbi:MAG: hypothetical protein WD035_07800 [Balneolaceae bacterium]